MYAILPSQYNKIRGKLIYAATVETFSSLALAKAAYVSKFGRERFRSIESLSGGRANLVNCAIFQVFSAGDRLEIGKPIWDSPTKVAANLIRGKV